MSLEDLLFTVVLFIDGVVLETVLGTPIVKVLPSTGRVCGVVVVFTGHVLSGGTEILITILKH